MDYKTELERWRKLVTEKDLLTELNSMGESDAEDAFCRNLTFGTGGLRGIIGAGTNRMNVYTVSKASQGLAVYLGAGATVVIGYDSRMKSDLFAKTAAEVFIANGIRVCIWPELSPVPTVSFAVRELHASVGVMITASHNPSQYNGYKVYGPDGCQITTEAAAAILAQIDKVDVFLNVKRTPFEEGLKSGLVEYIPDSVLHRYTETIKGESVLFGDEINRDVAIVYSPLNGTGLKPVMKTLCESGFTNITVVEEQRMPDSQFRTCPYPNPEKREAMALGLAYCQRINADLMLATDPDADRCGIAVRDGEEYRLLSGNEVGLLLLDFICAQRAKHNKMPDHPVFIKTIVTTDLAEKIAEHYGVRTINVLTGFKFIGERISLLENEADYIFGFEESFGYLTGTYVRDKDGINAAFMICEMFAFYKTRGISLPEKLDQIYSEYGYCLNTLHSYEYPGVSGIHKMAEIYEGIRQGLESIAGQRVVRTEDYSAGLYGLPKSDVMRFYTKTGSVVIRPSGTEPKLKVYSSIKMKDEENARNLEKQIIEDLETKMLR